MIICDMLGRMRLSVSAAPLRVPLLPWKQDSSFEWSITAISSDAIFLFVPVVFKSMFVSTSDSKFSSQLLSIVISEDSSFAASEFSYPGDVDITCVSTLVIIDILNVCIEEQGHINAHQ